MPRQTWCFKVDITLLKARYQGYLSQVRPGLIKSWWYCWFLHQGARLSFWAVDFHVWEPEKRATRRCVWGFMMIGRPQLRQNSNSQSVIEKGPREGKAELGEVDVNAGLCSPLEVSVLAVPRLTSPLIPPPKTSYRRLCICSRSPDLHAYKFPTQNVQGFMI